MKVFTAIVFLLVIPMAYALPISSHTAKVCLSIAPFAEVEINEDVLLTAIDASENNVPSHYRGETKLLVQSNTNIELLVSNGAISNQAEIFHPVITLNKQKGILPVPYSNSGHEVDLKMDLKLAGGQIVKAGNYEGSINVIVMAELEAASCI